MPNYQLFPLSLDLRLKPAIAYEAPTEDVAVTTAARHLDFDALGELWSEGRRIGTIVRRRSGTSILKP